MIHNVMIFINYFAMALMSHSLSLLLLPKSIPTQMAHKGQCSQVPNAHPHVVDTTRLSSTENNGKKLHIQHSEKLKEVRDALRIVVGKDPLESLVMIDALQRLGIDYHFEQETRNILGELHSQWEEEVQVDTKHNLFQLALGFRLLRQGGYPVSADVFGRFMDKDVPLVPELGRDIKGWTSLYEASQLCMEGEDIIVQAEDLSKNVLTKISSHCRHYEAEMIGKALRHPHHKSVARFMIKSYIEDFESNANKWRNAMKQLAKMDYNIVQLQHQKETQLFYEWWENKGLAEEMKLTRNEPLKWYSVSMAILAHPSHSEQRIDIAKQISLVYTIDDVYDICGTLEELVLLTKAVNRWDYEAVQELPRYMRECFRILDETTNELSDKIFRKHGHNATHYLRKTWADLCNAFLMEAKWFTNKHLPTPEEYLKNGTVSSGAYIIVVYLFFLLGENMTSSSLENLTENSKGMSYSVATMHRLWDDLDSTKDENREGANGSYLDCYMKHKNATRETAQEHVKLMIADAWRNLNTECLTSSAYSSAFKTSVLNCVRVYGFIDL